MRQEARTRYFGTAALLVVIAAVAVLAASGVPASAATSIIANTGPYSGGYGGGEFIETVVHWDFAGKPITWITPGNPLGVAPAQTFSTFCAQEDQYFYPGYTYTVEKLALVTNNGGGKPLTDKAAFLFHMWNSGALPDYDYSNASGGRSADATDLQRVLWSYFVQPNGDISGGKRAEWDTLATNAIGHSWTGFGGVRVMQLIGNSGGVDTPNAQDHLVEITPEPATLALVAIGALPLLPIVRRRRTVV